MKEISDFGGNIDANNATQAYMDVDVILTFDTSNQYEDYQEFFCLELPIEDDEISAFDFINRELFKRITLQLPKLDREPENLIKISTASNWSLFRQKTLLDALTDYGHPCKWYFGNGRNDLDPWEISLISRYQFGTNATMNLSAFS